jgi:PKD repeat protein
MSAMFSATCGAPLPANQCEFNATGSTTSTPTAAIVRYKWDWGDGRTELKTVPITRNTWQKAGTYKVVLTVTDAGGRTSVKTQYVAVGATAPGVVHDTVWLPSPPIHDTISVQLPAPPAVHDTTIITKIVHDTVTITKVRVDTVYIVTGPVTPPPPTPGRTVTQPTPGEWLVWQNGTLIGRLVALDISAGTWQAYQYIAGQMTMPCLGLASGACTIYPSQDAARDALP